MQESLLMVGTEPEVRLGELVDGVRFWGEVPTSELITGDALASAVGLTAGRTQHTNEPWLHFELDGKTLYVAKKTYRHTVNWNQIHDRGAVYGTRTVVINGLTYKVRLLTGADTDPTPVTFGYGPVGTSASEWDRLIYKVHNGVHTEVHSQTPPGVWPLYSDTDLVIHRTVGNGRNNWCQEARVGDATRRVCRGDFGVSYFSLNSASNGHAGTGWRPVLELVP